METRTTHTKEILYTSIVSTFRAGIVQYEVVTQDCEDGGNIWMENLQYAPGGRYDDLSLDLTDFFELFGFSIGPFTPLAVMRVSEELSYEFLESGIQPCKWTGPATPFDFRGTPDPNWGQKYRTYKIINTRTIEIPIIFNYAIGDNVHPFSTQVKLLGPCCQIKQEEDSGAGHEDEGE